MIWLFVAVAAVLVVATAWFAVNLATARLSATPAMAVFDIEEATDYVAENLPDRVAGRLSHDDVRLLLRWELTYFRERGVATFGGVDHAAEGAARRNQVVVANEDAVLDELLSRAREDGLDIDEVDIVCVTDLTSDYLVAIGAVGGAVDISGAIGSGVAGELAPSIADHDVEDAEDTGGGKGEAAELEASPDAATGDGGDEEIA